MNLLCPKCQRMLTVDDHLAGRDMQCPFCSGTFAAPALPAEVEAVASSAMSAPVPPAADAGPSTVTSPTAAPADVPTAPPEPPVRDDIYSFVPHSEDAAPPPPPTPVPPPVKRPRPRPAAAAPPPPPEPPPGYIHTRSFVLSRRIVALVGPICLLVYFIALFFSWVGMPGREETWQTGWGTAFGRNFSGLGIVQVIFFLLALLAAIACQALPRSRVELHPTVRQLLPWGSGIYGGLALFALIFLFLEIVLGFGIEREVYLRRTPWVGVAFLLNLLAVVAAGLDFWLAVRRSRPAPRIEIQW